MDQSNTTTRDGVANSILKPGLPELAIREFLAFKLGDEEYGMDILRVQEIRSFERPTRIVNAPAYFLGVVNLRGVIVLNFGKQVVDMVVDGVSDVITLTPEQLRPVPGARVLFSYRQRPPAGHRLTGKPHADRALYRKTHDQRRDGAARTNASVVHQFQNSQRQTS